MLKVDLHLHSAEDPIDQIGHDAFALVDRAATLGFHALAVTLHDRQLERPSLTAFAANRGIVLIPGVERTIDGKHVLLLNFPSEAARVCSFGDIRLLKRRFPKGLVVAPHPFYPGGSPLRHRLESDPDLFDAVEWSYFWTRALNCNAAARDWARRHGKPLVGNSDLHDIRQLGRTYSLIDAEPAPDAICDAVRHGRVQLVTSPVPYVELCQVFGGMVIRGKKPAGQLSSPHLPTPHGVRNL